MHNYEEYCSAVHCTSDGPLKTACQSSWQHCFRVAVILSDLNLNEEDFINFQLGLYFRKICMVQSPRHNSCGGGSCDNIIVNGDGDL